MASLFRRAVGAADEIELYDIVAGWFPGLVRADRVTLAMVEADQPDLRLVRLRGWSEAPEADSRVPLDGSGPGLAVTAAVTQYWQVADHPDRFEAGALSRAGLTSAVNAPLVVDGMAVGSLNVARAGEPYQTHEAMLIEELGRLVSVNLERFGAAARIEQQVADLTLHQRRLELLGQLGRRLSTTVSEEDAFGTLADLITDLLSVDRISLAFPNPGNQTFRIGGLSQEGRAPQGLGAGDDLPLANTGIGLVVADGRPRYFPDLTASSHIEHEKLAKGGFLTGASIPVHSQGRVVAVLNTASVTSDDYSVEDRITIEAVATIVGETLDRIKVQEALAIRDQQLAAIVDESPLLMMTINEDGNIAQLSEFGASQLGHQAAELLDRPLSDLYPADQRELVVERLETIWAKDRGEVVSWEAQMWSADGQRLWIRHSGRRMGPETGADSIILVCQDVTTLLELADRLEHEATHDPLTGLVNRREFDRRLNVAIGEAGEVAAGSVCYIDVDQFKIVNDTAGHRAGDALLVELSQLLESSLQSSDVVARLGGDEFAVFLPMCSLSDALRVAERLRLAAADLIFSWENRTFGVSLSIGVAVMNPDRPDTDDVMGRADDACYQSKYNGRNQVSMSTKTERDGTERPDGEWGSRLRDALQRDELSLMSQTIMSINGDDDLTRCELLVRLRDEDDQLLPTGLFIPAAERLGIVTEIDKWVVAEAVSLLCDPGSGLGEVDFVAINLSPRSIESDEFLSFLVAALSQVDLDPSRLLFEITETAALSGFSKAVRFIETVSTVGCRFALDDFGTGFSTFHYLKRLPVDVLKIDGSLIRDLDSDPIDRSIVRAIVEVASSLGMKTVAEFVETPNTIDRLRHLGVDYAQGYCIGRPQPIVAGPDRSR